MNRYEHRKNEIAQAGRVYAPVTDEQVRLLRRKRSARAVPDLTTYRESVNAERAAGIIGLQIGKK